MTAADIALIVGEIGPIIKTYVDQATTTLAMRNKELEQRILELETRPEPMRPERGEPGQKGDTGIGLVSLVLSADHRLLAHFSDGRMQDIGPSPQGERGEKGLTGERGAQGEPGERGEIGPPGKDAVPVDVKAIVDAVLAQLPAPERGEKGDPGERGPEGVAGFMGPVGPAGPSGPQGDVGAMGPVGPVGAMGPQGQNGDVGPQGKEGPVGPRGEQGSDGPGIVDALIDRHGHLVLTMSDGRTKDIGTVVGKDGADGIGKDGAPGRDGRDVDMDAVRTLISKELATWPRPKNGTDGRNGTDGLHGKDGRDGIDGKDGLGFDDVDLIFDEEKGYVFRLTNGDRVKEHLVPWPWDAQVYQAGRKYVKGAAVTWDGHFWIAQHDTTDSPGEGVPAWRLAVRRGKQGKEGKPGKDAVAHTTNTPPLYGY